MLICSPERNSFFTAMILAVADERRNKVLALELKCPIQVNRNYWIGGTVLWSSVFTGNCVGHRCFSCLVSALGIVFCSICKITDGYRYPSWTIMTIICPISAVGSSISTHTNNISESGMKKSIQVLTSSCVTVHDPHCIITSAMVAIIDMLDLKPLGTGWYLA